MIGLSSRIFVMNKEDAFIHAVHEYAEAKAEYDADLEANRDFYREQQRQYMLSMISGADGLKNAPPKSPQLINVGDKLQKMSIALNEYTAYLDANHIPRSRLAEVIRDNNLGPLMKN